MLNLSHCIEQGWEPGRRWRHEEPLSVSLLPVFTINNRWKPRTWFWTAWVLIRPRWRQSCIWSESTEEHCCLADPDLWPPCGGIISISETRFLDFNRVRKEAELCSTTQTLGKKNCEESEHCGLSSSPSLRAARVNVGWRAVMRLLLLSNPAGTKILSLKDEDADVGQEEKQSLIWGLSEDLIQRWYKSCKGWYKGKWKYVVELFLSSFKTN